MNGYTDEGAALTFDEAVSQMASAALARYPGSDFAKGRDGA